MEHKKKNSPLLLVILDGWGVREEEEGNAIALAQTPTYDRLVREYPATLLTASGEAVGLPPGQMGNSEVGHLNLGAGRTVYQEYTRINQALADGSFFQNPILQQTLAAMEGSQQTLHLVGLVSDGGVHSHLNHLFGLLEMATRFQIPRLSVHAILDGRDTAPQVGDKYILQLQEKLNQLQLGEISTVSGRYYSMDRDNRWERTERAYRCLVLGEGLKCSSALEAVQTAHRRGEGDEFVQPTVVGEGRMKEGDRVIFFNFRADRIRQLTRVLTDPHFSPFPRPEPPRIQGVTLTEYEESFPVQVLYPPLMIRNTLSWILSQEGLCQLHTAETEKYAHVTFFFNGGEEDPVPGEKRHLIPSPKVATYDLQPEMSAKALTDFVVRELPKGHDFWVLNYANPDMVGHTGMLEAAIQAISFVDTQLARILGRLEDLGGGAFITADHGNAEQMVEEGGGAHTAHTTNPVPFIYFGPATRTLKPGTLADVAPTILDYLGIVKPAEMTGSSLFKGGSKRHDRYNHC